jgi:hypothetical protein
MEFCIIRHKKMRNLIVRKCPWGNGVDYNLLDRLSECDPEKHAQPWIDITDPKSFTVDSGYFQFSCNFDFYKLVRKTLRYDVQDFAWRSKTANSPVSHKSNIVFSMPSMPSKYNNFVLHQQLDQEKFWHRFNKELDIEKYRVDIMSQQLIHVETLEFKDDIISPKKISLVA